MEITPLHLEIGLSFHAVPLKCYVNHRLSYNTWSSANKSNNYQLRLQNNVSLYYPTQKEK